MGRRDWGSSSGPVPEGATGNPDPEWDEYLAWRDREIAAGRDPEPETWVPGAWEGEAWEDAEWEDAAWEAAGRQAADMRRPLFTQDGEGDQLPPGPLLAGLTEQAIGDLGRLTVPDGPTEQCNLAPRCRTHHRAKQAPDWTVEQIAPGIARWTLPCGRTHITTPTTYDIIPTTPMTSSDHR